MKLTCKADFLSEKVFHSDKTGKDYHSMVVNGNGGQMELSMPAALSCKTYQPLEIEVEITQGKYPKYEATKIKML
jgi:hypothetical protein